MKFRFLIASIYLKKKIMGVLSFLNESLYPHIFLNWRIFWIMITIDYIPMYNNNNRVILFLLKYNWLLT